jgi:hypothetical protein
MIVYSFIIQANVITIVKSTIVNVYSTGHRLSNFLPIGLLLEAHYDFLKRQSSPKKWGHFGLLFVVANILLLT